MILVICRVSDSTLFRSKNLDMEGPANKPIILMIAKVSISSVIVSPFTMVISSEYHE
ncbi:hypothetical protein GCM10009123_00150 [Kangiella japonica]|uniref:Uncharacterized protein n=1 Tax=Kangiella japonica TaxID=647384 RepID=A0ABP3CDF3_9GAMM